MGSDLGSLVIRHTQEAATARLLSSPETPPAYANIDFVKDKQANQAEIDKMASEEILSKETIEKLMKVSDPLLQQTVTLPDGSKYLSLDPYARPGMIDLQHITLQDRCDTDPLLFNNIETPIMNGYRFSNDERDIQAPSR